MCEDVKNSQNSEDLNYTAMHEYISVVCEG